VCHETEIENVQTTLESINPCAASPCANGGICEVSNDLSTYTCTCTSSFNGDNCEDAAEISITSVTDLMDKVINGPFTRRRRSINFADLLQHGCFCPMMDGSVGPSPKGAPVSDYDEICRNNHWCQQCKAETTNCLKQDGYPYTVQLNNGAYECKDSVNNLCQQNQCECDMNTITRLVAREANTGVAIQPEACNGVVAAGATKNWQCCGTGSNWLIYNDNSRLECDDSGSEPRIFNFFNGNTVREYL